MSEMILGLNDGHNAAAALLHKGRVVAAVQEERMTRVKNQAGVPRHAINEVLSIADVDVSAIPRVGLNGLYMSQDGWGREEMLKCYEESGGLIERAKQPLKGTFVDRLYQNHKAQERKQQVANLGFENRRLTSVDHHTAHAASAYYGSGWSGAGKVLVLTCDGNGDRLSGSVSIGQDGRLERIAAIDENDSIGHLYAMVTYFMGMVPLEHEYKVMGLAPYVGDARKAKDVTKLFADLFEFDPKNQLAWRRCKGVPPMLSAYNLICKLLYRQRFDLVAAGLQQFTEDILTQWVRNCVRETGIRRVACGGGVFMNVKANKEILSLPEIEELFIFPSCGDETNSIGSAYWLHAQECLATNRSVDIPGLGHLYWGRAFEDAEIESTLKQFKGQSSFRYEYMEDIERHAAQILAGGDVVARAKGAMEFGARGLGNRSILAPADSMKSVRVINDMVKNRDFWMPFAPSVLEERAEDYYLKPKPISAPYMIIAFDSRPDKREKFTAGQHPYDYSVRPQEVCEAWNPDYYRLLKYYEEKTGEGILLNTSFNLHGFPVAYHPKDAMTVFDRSGLEYLAVGNWWVSKNV